MVAVANTAEGGSDETAVTTGNSGGSSGDAWDSVSIGTAATLVFDTAQAVRGSLSYRHATGATSTTANARWTSTTLTGSPSQLWGRFYCRFSDPLSDRSIARARSGTTQVIRLQITSSGTIQLRNSANSVVATSSTVLSADTWYRIEFNAVPGTTATSEFKIFVGDSTTATETVNGSSDYSSATTVDEFGIGNFANGADAPSMWYDDIEANSSGYPGPSLITVTPSAIAATATIPAATVATGATVSPGAIGATVTVPAAATAAGSTVSAAAVATSAAVPSPTVATGATHTATEIAAVASVPSHTFSAGVTVTAVAVAATATLPAASAATGSSISATAVAAVASVPSASVSTGGDTNISATAVAALASIPAAALSTGVTIGGVPAVVAVADLPAVGAGAGSSVGGGAIVAAAALDSPSLAAGSTASPSAIAVLVSIPAATLATLARASSEAVVSAFATSVPAVSAGRTSGSTVTGTANSVSSIAGG